MTVFRATRSTAAGAVERYVLEYAFGSDHHATTFVTVTGPAGLAALEHRFTHYAHGDTFRITPGQSAEKPFPGTGPHGRALPDWETVKCFRCHATRISAAGGDVLDRRELIPNVSCERCHGPAGEHVRAARAGRAELAMPFGLGRWTAESQMALCGQCHRHPSQAIPGRLRRELPELARFQPVGIMQSKCYTASDGALSCVNCHEPHSRASSDRTVYVSACLACHRGRPQTICPVAPQKGCIACHMPRVDAGQHVSSPPTFGCHGLYSTRAAWAPALSHGLSTTRGTQASLNRLWNHGFHQIVVVFDAECRKTTCVPCDRAYSLTQYA